MDVSLSEKNAFSEGGLFDFKKKAEITKKKNEENILKKFFRRLKLKRASDKKKNKNSAKEKKCIHEQKIPPFADLSAPLKKKIRCKVNEKKKLNLFKSVVCKTKKSIEDVTREFQHISHSVDYLGGFLNLRKKFELENKILHAENLLLRAKRKQTSLTDFEFLGILGRGAFGIVHLVRKKENGEMYALKQIKKNAIRSKNQRIRAFTERELLSNSSSSSCFCSSSSSLSSFSFSSSPSSSSSSSCSSSSSVRTRYIVNLYETFQDAHHLYQLLEYLPGGDLMEYLVKYDTFPEEVAKFYVAQLVLAVHEVHKLGYVHRDIKPDNIVLDSRGSIKLLDFGLCKFYSKNRAKVNKLNHLYAHYSDCNEDYHVDENEGDTHDGTKGETPPDSPFKYTQENGQIYYSSTTDESPKHLNREAMTSHVGTPHYMAPEVFGDDGYTNKVDWWSVGIIMFECLYGGVPFNDANTHNPELIIHRVKHWRQYLILPHPCRVLSTDAVDLMKKLLCDESTRICADEIRKHKWFASVPWDDLHLIDPPITPEVRYIEKIKLNGKEKQNDACDEINKELAWFGYTFKREEKEKQMQVCNIIENAEKHLFSEERKREDPLPFQTQINHYFVHK